MKLIIDNIAKISHVEIELDGISVICGWNDTGKSSVGKVLYAAFNSLYYMDQIVDEVRYDEIRSRSLRVLLEGMSDREAGIRVGRGKAHILADKIANTIVGEMKKGDRTEGIDVALIINSIIRDEQEFDSTEIQNQLRETVGQVVVFPEEKFQCEVVERWFRTVFGSQITNINSSGNGSVELIIKGKSIKIFFAHDKCIHLEMSVSILHKAFLIDGPHIMDDISLFMRHHSERYVWGYSPDSFMKHQLTKPIDDMVRGSIISSVQAKEKLGEVMELLERTLPGKLVESDGSLWIKEGAYKDGLMVANLSTGLKSLLIIRRMLELNLLITKDVIVFDEPEIHLHPEWQVLYAQLLVLLQRAFDLTMIVTTHSHYFLEAIDIFSEKYGRKDVAHYYLSHVREGSADIEEVTDDMEKIYKLMADPIAMLDSLRMEIEDGDAYE